MKSRSNDGILLFIFSITGKCRSELENTLSRKLPYESRRE
ncbi:hypothetical protein JCM19298_3086 [Nonlabens ulvanivorans]|nr:hypothetical protein JCM19298_3086 [Nonlabens ulvanivorans]